jgi:hypothetical protein
MLSYEPCPVEPFEEPLEDPLEEPLKEPFAKPLPSALPPTPSFPPSAVPRTPDRKPLRLPTLPPSSFPFLFPLPFPFSFPFVPFPCCRRCSSTAASRDRLFNSALLPCWYSHEDGSIAASTAVAACMPRVALKGRECNTRSIAPPSP